MRQPIAPVAPAEKRSRQRTAAADKVRRAAPTRPRCAGRCFALLPIALIVGGYWYVTGGQVMSTDDAYVDAEKVGISTDVSGIVQDVDVKENEHVTAGQVLYRLDPRQFQIALDNAKANLAQTALIDRGDEAGLQAHGERCRRAAGAGRSRSDQLRPRRHAAAKRHRDAGRSTIRRNTRSTTTRASSPRCASRRRCSSPSSAAIRTSSSTEHPQYLQAQAQVDEAQRQLDHTVIKAPFAGIVTDVPSIAPGKYLAASTTAFFLVDTDHVWVEANPKETELTYVRPGQPVTVTVDTYPDLEWHGVVESVSPAAAQEFSLLPAQNTSGNWVKVVQRVPMRVRVDTSDKNLPPLRAGMSVEVDVDTGHARGWPHFLTALFGRAHQVR